MEDFPHKISCQLISPSKSDIGKPTKKILDKINSDVLSSVRDNQWKNSQAVIEWFQNIQNKNNASVIVLDIERFYPSVSLEFFHKAINFVKTIRDIPEKDFPLLCNLHESCYSIIRNFVWKNLVMKSLMSNGMFWWCWSLWVSLCLHSAFVKDALRVFDDFEQKSAWSNIFWNVKVCVFRKCIQ